MAKVKSEAMKERVFMYECIICGVREPDRKEVPAHSIFDNVVIRLVRCEGCTRKRLPLPGRKQ